MSSTQAPDGVSPDRSSLLGWGFVVPALSVLLALNLFPLANAIVSAVPRM